jgi:hypothetical protein
LAAERSPYVPRAQQIDPVKLKGKGDTTAALQENVKSLISVAARFLERIKSCLPLCPRYTTFTPAAAPITCHQR